VKRKTKKAAAAPAVKRKRAPRGPRRPADPKPGADALKLLTTATRALVELYPADRTKPGLVLAWIPEKGKFYASFVRYENGGSGKEVLAKSYGETLEAAIEGVICDWRDSTPAAREMARLAMSMKSFSDSVARAGKVLGSYQRTTPPDWTPNE